MNTSMTITLTEICAQFPAGVDMLTHIQHRDKLHRCGCFSTLTVIKARLNKWQIQAHQHMNLLSYILCQIFLILEFY